MESVYRGLTPGGISTFYQHSCTPKAERACVGKTGNGKKRCIVYRYEMSLAREFDIFGLHSVDAMYPTYKPEVSCISISLLFRSLVCTHRVHLCTSTNAHYLLIIYSNGIQVLGRCKRGGDTEGSAQKINGLMVEDFIDIY